MPGQASARRANARRAQEKKAAKKAAKRAASGASSTNTTSIAAVAVEQMASIPIPSVTEDDLLSFQFSHFGDDGRPESWFIDAETALAYDPAAEAIEEAEQDLGYYPDGGKRTLTDAQIEMFRHSEIQQLEREERLRREAAEEDASSGSDGAGESARQVEAALEERRQSQSRRSESTPSIGAKRKRKDNVPYYERHKRKWEDFVEKEDPVHGSMTQNRLRREQDNKKEELVELDY